MARAKNQPHGAAPAGGATGADGGDALAAAAERAARAVADDEAGYRCPACLAQLPANAVLCTSCGTDLRTGEKVASADAKSPWAPKSTGPTAGGQDDDEDEADDDEQDGEPGRARATAEDLFAEGSRFRTLHLPLILLAAGLALSMYLAYLLGKADGGPVVERFLPLFVLAAVAMECVLLFAVLLISVKLFDTGLGGVGPALIRVLAAAILPGALGAMVEKAAGGGVGAIILAGLISILLYGALVKVFFNLAPKRAAPVVIVLYLVENWVKPLLLTAMLLGGKEAADNGGRLADATRSSIVISGIPQVPNGR